MSSLEDWTFDLDIRYLSLRYGIDMKQKSKKKTCPTYGTRICEIDVFFRNSMKKWSNYLIIKAKSDKTNANIIICLKWMIRSDQDAFKNLRSRLDQAYLLFNKFITSRINPNDKKIGQHLM